jgi:hypothetical protein
LYEFLAWLEGSFVGHAMRESGVWTYGVVNLIHILGVASLFGAVLAVDLRLLGLWRKAPLGAISDAAVPIATVGFCVAAISGIGLLATKATEYAGNPFFYLKFPAIGLGVVNVVVLNRVEAWKRRREREPAGRERRKLAVLGGISLLCWLTATAAGRMIGYW